MKKFIILIFSLIFLWGVNSAWASTSVTLDFEDADGVYWNGILYGQPIFGPGEEPGYYHGFYFHNSRVYDKDGIYAAYGANYLYEGTHGDRSLGRYSFDPLVIYNYEEDFYFESAVFAAKDSGGNDRSLTIGLTGYYDGEVVWSENCVLADDGTIQVIDFTSSYSNVLIDQLAITAWEEYKAAFILDNFTYTAAVPIPGSLSILGLGLAVFASLTRRQEK